MPKVVEQIRIEVRKRLGICQFYLYFNSDTCTYPEEDVKITVSKDKISLNSESISTGINVIPDSLSSLTYYENVLSFRIRLQLTENKIVSSPLSNIPSNSWELNTQLKTGDSTILTCFQCMSPVFHRHIKIKHISPDVDLSEIFCHRSENSMEFEKHDCSQPYDTCNVQLDEGYIAFPRFPKENLDVIERDKVIHCRRCLAWLGILDRNNSTVRFWYDTTKFDNTMNAWDQEDISKFLFYAIINRTMVECFFPICNIVLKIIDSSNSKTCIFLSILDRNLHVIEYKHQTGVTEKTYIKIMFEMLDTEDAEKQNIVHRMEIVSKPTFLYAYKTLSSMSDKLLANGNVAYLQL